MKTNAEVPSSSNAADVFKWIVTFVLLAVAVVGNALLGGSQEYVVYNLSVVIRAIAVIVLIAAALGMAALTKKGKNAIDFARESRMEVRKVVWPTRQETIQTTLIVLAVCIVMALALWGVDGIMVRLVSLITKW